MNTRLRLISSALWLTLVTVFCVMAVFGWASGVWYGLFFTALFAVTLGGYIFQNPQVPHGYMTLSPKALVVCTLTAIAGMVAGGFVGAVLAGWLCIIIAFGVIPPWQELSPAMRDAGLLIAIVGLWGGIVGSAVGGRCLYRYLRRKMTAPEPDFQDPTGDYDTSITLNRNL